MNSRLPAKWFLSLMSIVCFVVAVESVEAQSPDTVQKCERIIRARVVALDQPYMWNRLGSAAPGGMVFALERDVVPNDAPVDSQGKEMRLNYTSQDLKPGQVRLRSDKRPRPFVFRARVGDCLEIALTNLLTPTAQSFLPSQLQVTTRTVGLHVMGLELMPTISSDGQPLPGINSDSSFAGSNPNSYVASSATGTGQTKIYRYYAGAEGAYLLYSGAADEFGQTGAGLFGAVNVEPQGAEWYRSQVTREDLHQATYRTDQLPPTMTIRPKTDPSGRPLRTADEKPLFELKRVTPEARVSETITVFSRDEDGHLYTESGHPLINYNAVYQSGPRAGTPILSMLAPVQTPAGQPPIYDVVHSDLTAIITGPNAGRFPYPIDGPSFYINPASPDRRQPYREFTIHYHNPGAGGNVNQVVQPFQQYYDPQISNTLGAGADNFAINYGMAGIGSEILANRLGVGPMGNADAVDLKYEEFFLSSWSVGDPAMVVDIPANAAGQVINNQRAGWPSVDTKKLTGELSQPPNFPPLTKTPATRAFYPDDPSNVYHSYLRDHMKFRVLHAGPNNGQSHVHHLHAHQWLHSPNSDNSQYLDSQMLVPGASYTLEMVYNGSGNRNQTVGDSIFHCHFYPHFAQGMWSLWRVHDVFEAGTEFDSTGLPKEGWNRVLPDGEIVRGTPIPAIVPLPTLGMAPLPAKVRLTTAQDGPNAYPGRRVIVEPKGTDGQGEPVYDNPGFPFFVPGVAGHRAPHPPMDFAWVEDAPGKPRLTPEGEKIPLDGGLPRHQVLDGKVFVEVHNRWDFTKDFVLYADDHKTLVDGNLKAFELPEAGTAVEKAAMRYHAIRAHATPQADGAAGNFITNGLPPTPGAPYADPAVDDNGNSTFDLRRYQAAVIQTDVVLNKKGWHFPQQRFITLWHDVKPTVEGTRPPQPFFFRSATGDTVEFWHTNLVPNYYELDDFQVRTPTDVLGQHIHLVKFDVTSSDGGGNGFNYEDGTFSPDEVRERIFAINKVGGLFGFDPKTQFIGPTRKPLQVKSYREFYPFFGNPPAGQDWDGAQTTIQRYDTDPLLNHLGEDRTLRSVFTHDHFGPSTHQQVGLYAAMLVEPQGSTWQDPVTGETMYTRADGGPTGWQANIITANPADSYREFAMEFQDFQLAYQAASRATTGPTPATSGLFLSDTAYAKELDAARIPPALRNQFAANGVTLTPQAAVTVQTKGSKWLIKDSAPPDMNQQYQITKTGTGTTGLNVNPLSLKPGWSDPTLAVSPPTNRGNKATGGAPFPTIISALPAAATYSLNYRNEPLPLRVNADPPNKVQPTNPQQASDLSHAFRSIMRYDPQLNSQPGLGQPIDPNQPNGFKFPLKPLLPETQTPQQGGVTGLDPYTPMLRAYENDRIQIRTIVGAHTVLHPFQIQGLKWFFEPTYTNSGYQSMQGMGLSEHYEFLTTVPKATTTSDRPFADYLYAPSSGTDGLTSGLWGIVRAYDPNKVQFSNLIPLPNNDPKRGTAAAAPLAGCPADAPVRQYNVTAITAKALPGGVLTYNARGQATASSTGQVTFNPPLLTDSNALIYVRTEDLDSNGSLKPGVPIEPLVLRAAAGECVSVSVSNRLAGFTNQVNASTMTSSPFGKSSVTGGGVPNITMNTSTDVGLIPQLMTRDIAQSNGGNIGYNPVQTVSASATQPNTFRWYAGNLSLDSDGEVQGTPVEFGTIHLMPSDPLLQHQGGLIGALIIEPFGSTWCEDAGGRTSAVVYSQGVNCDDTKARAAAAPLFREFVAMLQNDVENFNLSFTNAYNYRSEPWGYRYPGGQPSLTDPAGYSTAESNSLINNLDPQTAIFTAAGGTAVRFRMLFGGGSGTSTEVPAIHGHNWQEEPWINNSTQIGANDLSQTFGSQIQVPYQPLNIVIDQAGGVAATPGDYLYHTYQDTSTGSWGLFRVGDNAVIVTKSVLQKLQQYQNLLTVQGYRIVKQGVPPSGQATQVTISVVTPSGGSTPVGVAPIQSDGTFVLQLVNSTVTAGATLRIQPNVGVGATTTVR